MRTIQKERLKIVQNNLVKSTNNLATNLQNGISVANLD